MAEDSIAGKILHRLFTNGAGHKADRLLLIKDELHRREVTVNNAQYLGGYSRDAVFSILRAVLPDAERLLQKIATASIYDPGETDLDDEQPINLSITLGDVRTARRLLG